jgi:hypothetical protein
MNSIEDKILDNMKFRQIFNDNVVNNPWLLNYELGSAEIPGEGEGTVYSTHGQLEGEDQWTVLPTIMEDEEGKLKYYKDDWKEKALGHGYGIKFNNEDEAERFSKWLSKLHEMTGMGDGQSYDL